MNKLNLKNRFESFVTKKKICFFNHLVGSHHKSDFKTIFRLRTEPDYDHIKVDKYAYDVSLDIILNLHFLVLVQLEFVYPTGNSQAVKQIIKTPIN